MAGARLVVLGIDAAAPSLIERGCGEGWLPNLGVLKERGLTGDVRSVDGFFVGSTWPSLQTGVSPARHGLHYLVQLEPGTYEYRRKSDGEFIRGEPFWRALERAGLRTAVLDVPLTRPESTGRVPAAAQAGVREPGDEGGAPFWSRAGGGDPWSARNLHVVEWGSHDAVYGFQCSPAGLEADLLARFGAHPQSASCDDVGRTAEGYGAFIETLIRGVRQKSALTRHCLRAGEHDFLMQVFTEAHCCGHQCWHLHDRGHPSHDPAMAERLGDPLERVYAAIDEAIGEIVSEAGDAAVVVLSAHGMGHAFGAHFLLHDMLFRLGVSARPASGAAGPLRRTATSVARRAWRALPESGRAGIRSLRERLARDAATLPGLRVDAARSLCFPVHNGLAVGGIRLNLVGREPRGRLPEREVDGFCAELSDGLLGMVDDETGEPVVSRVMRTSQLYHGELLETLPDLLVEWNDTRRSGNTLLAGGRGSVLRVRSTRTGLLEGVNDYGRTGEHRIDGFFIAAGAGIAPGRLDTPVRVMDFAPTFAARLGAGMADVEGGPIRRLVESGR